MYKAISFFKQICASYLHLFRLSVLTNISVNIDGPMVIQRCSDVECIAWRIRLVL